MKNKTIGIIGGMGPYAGIDIHNKIYQNTLATSDKDYLDVIHFALAKGIPDRTEFLLGKTAINPADVLANKICNYPLDVIGIACNTFHAPKIFSVFQAKLGADVQVLHLPNEIKKAVTASYKNTTIGVLCTLGTQQSRIYQDAFKDSSIRLQFPSESGCNAIHEAIYHEDWGIKRKGRLSPEAKAIIEQEIKAFSGVTAVLLACTELPLVVDKLSSVLPLIDCNLILAKALIEAVSPKHLSAMCLR